MATPRVVLPGDDRLGAAAVQAGLQIEPPVAEPSPSVVQYRCRGAAPEPFPAGERVGGGDVALFGVAVRVAVTVPVRRGQTAR